MGMHPQEELTPVDPSLLRPGLVIFDLVYEPFETRLLAEAKKRGAKVIDGLTMLVFQGAVSFETWTGVEAPVEVMMKAAAEEVARRKGGEP
jgi:shikimate dehydrogenase